MKRLLSLALLLVILGSTYVLAQTLNNPGGQVNPNNPSAFQTGVWTPTLAGSTTAGSATYISQVGSYEHIGRMVMARFAISLNATPGSTAAGGIQISGFPFVVGSATDGNGNCVVSKLTGYTFGSGYTFLAGVMTPAQSKMMLMEGGSGKTALELPVTTALGSTPAIIQGFCNYHSP